MQDEETLELVFNDDELLKYCEDEGVEYSVGTNGMITVEDEITVPDEFTKVELYKLVKTDSIFNAVNVTEFYAPALKEADEILVDEAEIVDLSGLEKAYRVRSESRKLDINLSSLNNQKIYLNLNENICGKKMHGIVFGPLFDGQESGYYVDTFFSAKKQTVFICFEGAYPLNTAVEKIQLRDRNANIHDDYKDFFQFSEESMNDAVKNIPGQLDLF